MVLFRFTKASGGNLLSAALYADADGVLFYLLVGETMRHVVLTSRRAASQLGAGRWSW